MKLPKKLSAPQESGNSSEDMPLWSMNAGTFHVEIGSHSDEHDKEIPEFAKEVRKRVNAYDELVNAIEHVLIASEDGGDTNDINWRLLQKLHERHGKQAK